MAHSYPARRSYGTRRTVKSTRDVVFSARRPVQARRPSAAQKKYRTQRKARSCRTLLSKAKPYTERATVVGGDVVYVRHPKASFVQLTRAVPVGLPRVSYVKLKNAAASIARALRTYGENAVSFVAYDERRQVTVNAMLQALYAAPQG